MDIEQLKLIIESVGVISADARDVAIVWVIADKVLPAIVWLVSIPAVVFAFKSCARIFISNSIDTPDGRTLRDELGVGCSGYVNQQEADMTIREAIRVVREYKLMKKQS